MNVTPLSKLAISSLILVALIAPATGCSSTRTSSTTTVHTEEGTTSPSQQDPAQQPQTKVVTEKTETVTEKESSGPWCGGILSCTFEGVGWVLALPFRLVGGAIDVIF
jgi:hypothetical protein